MPSVWLLVLKKEVKKYNWWLEEKATHTLEKKQQNKIMAAIDE